MKSSQNIPFLPEMLCMAFLQLKTKNFSDLKGFIIRSGKR